MGRQAAYKARTRAALITSAQEVLAEIGLEATIEDLANHAQVSPATIYNHFENKEVFLKEALDQIWHETVMLAYEGKTQGENFELMIDVCRKLLRFSPKKSLFGRVIKKTFLNSTFAIDAIRPGSEMEFKDAILKSGLATDDFDARLNMWSYCLAGIFEGVFVSEKMTPSEADQALKVSLAIWNLTNKQAERLTSRPITSN